MKKAGSLLRLPAPESNAALAVAAPALRFPRLWMRMAWAGTPLPEITLLL